MPLSWHYGGVICGSCDVVFLTSSKPGCEKSGKTPVELTDAQIIALLQKEAAKRHDPARIYTEADDTTGLSQRFSKPRSSRPTCRKR
ncbi:hypothetical protein [Arthrobacter sp. VKM Ac-2550]|uniref:hypothetical protein n=1 Tax=Crystallibacter permensis TaxID=1938888 RepID=UPI0022417E5A|nr:hypothetical protein [Arthrobacter sp. VKM Ac-2550]MCW2133770.1 hypothetical protein [Arthrobacter sp. VKM Ac-2550]